MRFRRVITHLTTGLLTNHRDLPAIASERREHLNPLVITASQARGRILYPAFQEGIPAVVTDYMARFQKQWSPDAFSAAYGSQRCVVEDCNEVDNQFVCTVREFYANFGKSPRIGKFASGSGVWKLKVTQFNDRSEFTVYCLQSIGLAHRERLQGRLSRILRGLSESTVATFIHCSGRCDEPCITHATECFAS